MGTFVTPQSSLPEVQAIETTAEQLVSSRFDTAQNAAQSATQVALSLLSEMGNIGQLTSTSFVPNFLMPSFPTIDVNITPPPAPSPITYNSPATPIQADITIDPGNVPIFDVATLIPDIPVFPDLIFPTLTESTPIVHDIVLPEEPIIELPDPPIFNTVVLPDPMSINLPVFDAVIPVDNIVIPPNVIDPGILEYDTPILQMLKDKILYWISMSGTGLDPVIEQEIYDRDNERANLALQDIKQKASDEWSKRGFVLPNGVLAALFSEKDTEFFNKRLDTSREIIINQAKLAQENTRFYIEKALLLETQLMSWTNLIGQRTFDASKATMETSISLTQLEISRFNIKLEVYRTRATVYETMIRSELAKVEIYRAQIEAARTTAEVNRISAEIYKTRIDALMALIQIYDAEIRAAMAVLQVDKTKIEAFQATIQAYIAQINGITSKYNAYNSRIQGEKAKVDIYVAQIEGFKGKVDAYKSEAQIKIEEARARIEQNRNLVTLYSAEVSGAVATVTAESESTRAISATYIANIDAQKAKSEAMSAQAQAIIKSAQVEIEASLHVAEGIRNTMDVNSKNYLAMQTLRVEAARGGAAVAAQLAAGAMAGVNVSAAIHAQASAAQSYQGSEVLSESHSYSETSQ